MAFYEPAFVKDVQSSTDLVDLMREYGEEIQENRTTSKNAIWICSCPGKKLKNKSRINKIKQLYNCYTCGNSGNCFNFIMNKHGGTFPEAVEFLAIRAGLPLPESNHLSKYKKRSDAFLAAITYYQKFSSEYFKKRGMDPEDVLKAKAGYAPGFNRLKNTLLKEGYEEAYLQEIGLLNSKGSDAFFSKVVFPVYLNGYIVDLYGRHVDDESEYKHLYAVGINICYGIDEVKQGNSVILVESVFNAEILVKVLRDNEETVLEYFKNGVSVVAIGGCTKLSEFHINLLKKKRVPFVIVCYDTDSSGGGQRNSLIAGKLLQEREITTRIMEMPLDVDVNAFFVKEGRSFNEFIDLLTKTYSVTTYEHLTWLRQIPKELLEAYREGEIC
ncbi:MAG: primase [Bacilli bacterium]|nr:primase [Bacilli bacterium]